MNTRLIAIGDIHGHTRALDSVLNQIQPAPADTIVTLGDVINRGPDSKDVIQRLLDQTLQCQVVPILGNHEEAMLDSRRDRSAFERWRSMGGQQTLDSYGAMNLSEIPDQHWEFLESFRSYHETENFIFTHANYTWHSEMPQQQSSDLRWLSLTESRPKPHISGKTVILGHTPGTIRDYGYLRCIDTGCGFGGVLTAMDVQTGEFWQATEDGQPVRLS